MTIRVDPYASYNFSVEMNGITRAGFRECSGLENTQSSGPYREGTDKNLGMRRISGLNTYSDITLSRGFTNDNKLWEWRVKAMNGALERQSISITLIDDVGSPRITWNLFEAWPSGWTGPSLNAAADEIAIEQITIAYERIEVDQWT